MTVGIALFSFTICMMMLLTAAGDIPKGYILDVKVDCGKTISAKPKLSVSSDMSLYVTADCANGEKLVTTTDDANYLLDGSYTSPSADCIFIKRKNSNMYTVDVSVAYGVSGETVQTNPQFYTLTCTFDDNGKQVTGPITVTRGYIAPTELRVDAGKKTSSVITLDVNNVRGEIVTSDIIRGCKIYLSAKTDGKNSEVGLRPTSCDAISPKTKKRLPMLRAGCGTGLILPKNSGFTSTGKISRSPYFDAVQIEDEGDIQFECVFTLCSQSCNGNSCKVGKSKRSVDVLFEGGIVRSQPSNLHEIPLRFL